MPVGPDQERAAVHGPGPVWHSGYCEGEKEETKKEREEEGNEGNLL